ncbi:unnamed protein product [Bursaphelenchus xylophilus]|uniref:(pine wood nematode) hypothetical protein n=1 Tax=Bursaphelenchus xylophilus TaxID=6326 RepID=A0A7I8X712_BURXY|nr:unnamed protein product [Bursaphelenchus xylophilus]CAG9126422.1 unnamed protein product [Bursaphelenchus xylophilus]
MKTFSLLALLFGLSQASQQLSPCLQKCLEPMAKIEKTISYVYRNYEDVCDILEKQALCAQDCSATDRAMFFQYTTFYRIHCVDMEEELEDHMPCLKEASYKADFVCRDKCQNKQQKTLTKEEKQSNVCKTVECSTLCYFKQFSESCPKAQNVMVKLNVRNAEEMRRLTHEKHVQDMSEQCRRIHDGDYIRSQLLDAVRHDKPEKASKSEKSDKMEKKIKKN